MYPKQQYKISLNCKLDSYGAYGFLKPLSKSSLVSEIDVFRDEPAKACDKVIYHVPKVTKGGFWGQSSKLLKMLVTIGDDTFCTIGIYEIPHGLLAFIVGKIRRIPIILSFISNPGNTEIVRGFRKFVTYLLFNKSDIITVTGMKSRAYLINKGINRDKIYILPNSIDLDLFVEKKNKKKYDLISLGRLSHEKELGNLLKIVSKLKEKKTDIKLGIAGKGPQVNYLENKIIEHGLTKNVKLLGYVDDITDFYNSGKVFVLTSRTEGLPRTIIEAMACGIPCVASNVGDMEDVIDNDANGYLISDYKDLDSFAVKINLLLNDNLKYKKISENSRSKIETKYSYKAATKVWEEIIKKIGDYNI